MGGFPSGQREQTVNLSSMTSVVRIHHLPPNFIYNLVYKLIISYGRFPEWPKGTDCKSVVYDFGGSNPPPPTKRKTIHRMVFLFIVHRKISSGSQNRNSTVFQSLTSTFPYAGSKPMAGSVLRNKMRSLRQGKAEESKGEEKPWFVLSFCPVAQPVVQT